MRAVLSSDWFQLLRGYVFVVGITALGCYQEYRYGMVLW